jgi:hypothetical protein
MMLVQAFAILEMPLLFMIMRLLLLIAAFQVGRAAHCLRGA